MLWAEVVLDDLLMNMRHVLCQICPDRPVPAYLGDSVYQWDGHPPRHEHHPEDPGRLSTTQHPI